MIGDSVNTASRLEGVTKELSGSLLISETVVEALGYTTEYAINSLGAVDVKGKEHKLKVYGIALSS